MRLRPIRVAVVILEIICHTKITEEDVTALGSGVRRRHVKQTVLELDVSVNYPHVLV
jgi:hypothetical protein